MISQLPFQQVDVFTDTPFQGNPVAVVLDADHLSTEEMQRIANWTNLSETTFVCKPANPKADYKLRIFTPKNELPFAGHPTLGSSFAILKRGITPKTPDCLVQESKIGLVNIKLKGEKIFFSLPSPDIKNIDCEHINALANALGINPKDIKNSRLINIGSTWITLQLPDDKTVKNLHLDMNELSALISKGVTGVTVFGAVSDDEDIQFEVRSFAPNEGVPEDPVCGSGNGCVAYMVKEFNLIDKNHYTAAQGKCVGRNGCIEVRFEKNGNILLGGNAVTCIEGDLNIN